MYLCSASPCIVFATELFSSEVSVQLYGLPQIVGMSVISHSVHQKVMCSDILGSRNCVFVDCNVQSHNIMQYLLLQVLQSKIDMIHIPCAVTLLHCFGTDTELSNLKIRCDVTSAGTLHTSGGKLYSCMPYTTMALHSLDPLFVVTRLKHHI